MFSEERTRWMKASFRIFGNDESLAMYRRTGGRCSGGVEGGALHLEKWNSWCDSEENVRAIAETGGNILHCRVPSEVSIAAQTERKDPRIVAVPEFCAEGSCRAVKTRYDHAMPLRPDRISAGNGRVRFLSWSMARRESGAGTEEKTC